MRINKLPAGNGMEGKKPSVTAGLGVTRLAGSLTNLGLGQVIDKTDLLGRYDFKLRFNREVFGVSGKGESAPTLAPAGPSIFTALEEQLGLRLMSQKVQVEYFVIDSAEKPTEN